MAIPVQLSLFEQGEQIGACVGLSPSGTALHVEATDTFDTGADAAKAGLSIARQYTDEALVIHDPVEALPADAADDVVRRTEWSGAPCSSVVDHFAAYEGGEWSPPFSLTYGPSPEPPYDIYTDGTHTPREHQDEGRTEAGVGFVVAGTNDVIYACGAPAPYITDSLDSEYYAILSALMTVERQAEATVYTDHRNVPTVASGDAPDRCAHVTDRLVDLFEETPTLTIEHVERSATRLADGLATAGTRQPVTLGTPS